MTQSTKPPLSAWLLSGGLPRIAEELARVMGARTDLECSYLLPYEYQFGSHPAPASPPGEDSAPRPPCEDWCDGCRKERYGEKAPHRPREYTPETARHFDETTEANCAVRLPYSDPLMAFREVCRWRDMQARTYEEGSALLERFRAQEEQLVEAIVKLAALETERAHWLDIDPSRRHAAELEAKLAASEARTEDYIRRLDTERNRVAFVESERNEVLARCNQLTGERDTLELCLSRGDQRLTEVGLELAKANALLRASEFAGYRETVSGHVEALVAQGKTLSDKLTESEATVAQLRKQLEQAEAVVTAARQLRESVGLGGPYGLSLANALAALDQSQPKHVCNCCCLRPAVREAVSRQVTWRRLCAECLDRHFPEGNYSRGDYFEPDGIALDQSQPKPARDRAIVVGSTWRNTRYGHTRTVRQVERDRIHWRDSGGFTDIWTTEAFLEAHEHISDPPAVSDSAEEVK